MLNTNNATSDDDDQSEDETDPIVAAQREMSYMDPVLTEVEEQFAPGNPWNDDLWVEFDVRGIDSRVTRTSEYVRGRVEETSYRRREGPRNIPAECRSESDFLDLFWTVDILQRFVDQSNSYNRNRARPYWKSGDKDLTVPELKKYFAVIMYMGIHRLPNRKMYWKKRAFFSRDSYLHALHPIDLTRLRGFCILLTLVIFRKLKRSGEREKMASGLSKS